MYKGERREGVYIRIHIYFSAITPTVPVRLDRKRFDRSIEHNWFLPHIDDQGMPLQKEKCSEWTLEDDILLLNEIKKETGTMIEWGQMRLPEGYGSNSKRARWRKLREKHSLLKVDRVTAADQLIDMLSQN